MAQKTHAEALGKAHTSLEKIKTTFYTENIIIFSKGGCPEEKNMTNKSIPVLLAGIALLLVCALAGCASAAQPMTQAIEQWAAGAGNVKDFQYYISRNIILTKSEDPTITNKVAGSGQIEVTHTKQIIQIAGSTEGELLKTETDPQTGYTVYYIAFESENDNYLRFAQRGPGPEEKIYLLYDDLETSAINYGGIAYIVDWKAGEGLQVRADDIFGKVKGKVQGVSADDADQPYLLVRMEERVKEKENYRKASGRKVGG
jgi:hypothetical protein